MHDGSCDRLQNTLSICHHVVVVEAKHAITFGREERISTRIALHMRSFKMLSAINLDNEIGVVTNEVDNVGPNRRLAPEACAGESMCSHTVPDDPLGVG